MKNLFLLLTLPSVFGFSPDGYRIIRGDPAIDGQFPYMASIRRLGIHFCGGAIISNRWVLSVAHCNLKADFFTQILVGTVSQQTGGNRYSLTRVIKHENYHKFTKKDDIALVKTSTEIRFGDFVKPALIGNPKESTENEIYFAAGWGTLSSVTRETPAILQYVELEVLGLEECRETYGYTGRPELVPWEKQICTFAPKGTNEAGTCEGDSGGPLVSSYGLLVGLLSYGPTEPCGYLVPDVFTRVYSYVDWIEQRTQQKIANYVIQPNKPV